LFSVSGGAPSASEVNDWLDEGAGYIDAKLSNAGYTTPVASSASAYKLLRNLNATFGAAMVEMSRNVANTAAGEQTRGAMLESRFWKGVDNLLTVDLSALGVPYTSAIYAGGISIADKNSVEDNTDRPMTAFKRGMFANPGAGTTEIGTSDDDEED
jgi:hypothetical protein